MAWIIGSEVSQGKRLQDIQKDKQKQFENEVKKSDNEILPEKSEARV